MSTEVVNTAGSPPADRVRDTMSFSNILSSLAASPTDMLASAPFLEPPSTPKNNTIAAKEEEVTPPDTNMTDVVDTVEGGEEDAGDSEVEEGDVPDEDREFICMNDVQSRCRTGQYTKILSRKVISDHFGRNKACTRDITDWPLFCRKHYQRATYNKKLWQIRKLDLIHRQFDVIENQFPGTTYDIVFKKSEEARLNEYSRKVASGMPEADAKKCVVPKPGKHFEAPIDILRELYLEVGKGKTIDEVKAIAELILKMLQDESTEQVPSIEFLPQLPGKITSSPVKVPKTPSPKKSGHVKTPSTKGTPGYVSSRGSVKKSGKI